MSRHHPSDRAGFTLIEVMVVVVLISILSGVMVAEMSGSYHDALLRSTGRQLMAVFDLASSRAIALNRRHRVHFDRWSGRYAVETRRRGEYVPLEGVAGSQGTLDAHIVARIRDAGREEREGGLENAIAFYPDGTADRREIELRDPEGFGLALRINPVTARVQVVELERQ